MKDSINFNKSNNAEWSSLRRPALIKDRFIDRCSLSPERTSASSFVDIKYIGQEMEFQPGGAVRRAEDRADRRAELIADRLATLCRFLMYR